jgi:hypothetical protein
MAAPEFDGPITGADLLAVINKKRVCGRYREPTAAQLDRLALAISLVRGRCQVGRPETWTPGQIARDQLQRKASHALGTLAEVLPRLRADYEAEGPFPAPDDLGRLLLKERLEQIRELERIVADVWELTWLIPYQELHILVTVESDWMVEHCALPAPTPVREIHKWHDFAFWLADKFRDVLQNCNPGRPRPGAAENGPVVKFLAGVIPLVTGEEPKAAAVKEWLRRAAETVVPG